MSSAFCLDNLPRSVNLSKGDDGSFQFCYLDQRLLPGNLEFVRTNDYRQVIEAIKTLAVRGAPAIGIAGASAVCLWAASELSSLEHFEEPLYRISSARPTAVNLKWAVDQMGAVIREGIESGFGKDHIIDNLFLYEKQLEAQDEQTNRAIGDNGAALLQPGSRILTHCNAGSLATVFYGTALGIVYSAAAQGKVERVYADETRPLGQGSRLTSWELSRAGVPVTLICDNMAASLMAQGQVDAVIVGADRIAANGDAANKIGTYGVAVLAKHHGIPFYVAAPISTFDFSLADGSGIPIEQRNPSEVLPQPIEGVSVWNPAFDVTPADLVTAIITEKGVYKPEEVKSLSALCND